jgi:hypothetical protein
VPAPSVDRPQATQYRRNCSRPARLAAARASAGGSHSKSHLRRRPIGTAAVHSSVLVIGTVADASSCAIGPAIRQCSPRMMQLGVASTRSAHTVPAAAFSDRFGRLIRPDAYASAFDPTRSCTINTVQPGASPAVYWSGCRQPRAGVPRHASTPRPSCTVLFSSRAARGEPQGAPSSERCREPPTEHALQLKGGIAAMHPAVPDGRNARRIVSYTVPIVVEQTNGRERGYDIFSLLLRTGSSSSARPSTMRCPI